MKKRSAQIVTIVGALMFILPFVGIYQLFVIARDINSQPNPPTEIILYNLPLLGNMGIGEVWNSLAVVMTIGVVVIMGGIAKYNLITHYA